MARLRDSRSPSPAGSHRSSRRTRDEDDRSNRERRSDHGGRHGGDDRSYRRRSRSRSPKDSRRGPRYDDRDRDRGPRDRRDDRDRDYRRHRDRSLDRRRDDDYYRRRDDRPRRRSRDGVADRPPSPASRRRDRSRDDGRDRRRRDHSRDRLRGSRERNADSRPRSARGESRSRTASLGVQERPAPEEARKAKPVAPKSEADVQAERRAKLDAWKKKRELEVQVQAQNQKGKNASPAQTRTLLAEMDKKTNGSATASPGASTTMSPTEPGGASPAAAYAGKFDPKAIAKKSSAAKSHEKGVLGSPVEVNADKLPLAQQQAAAASALPANRAKTSAFGLGKAMQEPEKLQGKRKLDLDEEDETKRTLTKLPALPDTTDDTPYADQDDDDDDEDESGAFAENEEEAAAAARALQERRLQAEQESKKPSDEEMKDATEGPTATAAAAAAADVADDAVAAAAPVVNGLVTESETPNAAASTAQPQQMDVDDVDDVDPLDAFMAGLDDKPARPAVKTETASKQQEPEAYFSDDDYGIGAEEDADAKKLLAIANKRKKKDIPRVDYSKLNLDPVRKNFWVEPSELSTMSEADVTDLRLELDGIKVNGKDVPKPIQKWAHCGLSRATLDVIDKMGFEKPTAIQMQAIPALMSGRDVIGVAKTGSGKTLAFLLPMFRHIKDQNPLKDMDGPVGLIMAPTRELAVQIHRECKPFLSTMGLRAVCGYGGAPIKDQIAELKRGAEIVVCTPGRLIDLLAANQGRVTNLRRVTYVVLDEADRMFDMGFEPQIMKVFANMRPDKQTILFSATMPRIVDSLTKKVLKDPVEVTVGGRSVVAKEIEQIVEIREETTKFLRVLELLGELYDADEDARSLIFVERQEKADDLLKELMVKGYPCMSIHGGKDQVDRDSTIADFKSGVIPILIATSIAARGLDVKQLKLVINYDAPNHLEDYVHRAGRTGRAGNTGVAVTFVTPQQENCAPGICKALEQSEQPVPEQLNEMRKAHREKVKSGKAKDTSGFGGKGLDRLDQDREAARNRERKTHKAEGEEDEEKEKEDTKDNEDKHEKALNAIRQAASGVQARQDVRFDAQAQIDAKVSAIKPGREGDAQAASSGGDKGGNDPLDKVSSAISAINSRLGKSGQLRAGQPIDNKGPDAGAFHATLEINDFPQKARWAVTNRTNVAKILEATGVSITTKGNFYPAGKEVPEGAEPKLYILIEGDTELVVSAALNEMTRLLREGTIAAAEADSRAPASGRYTVA